MVITSPMLAAAVDDVHRITFPCLATPKVDGVRALKLDGHLVTRQLKPIRNTAIARILCDLLPDGADGEIVVGDSFASTSSAVMSDHDTRTFRARFTFHWFDYVSGSPDTPYAERMRHLQQYLDAHPDARRHPQATVQPLLPVTLERVTQLADFEMYHLARGFEGIVLRDPGGAYKMGRSTQREGGLLKLKRFLDDEATVERAEELFHNNNPLVGGKRSRQLQGMAPAGTLGALRVRCGKLVFRVGSGFHVQLRARLWQERAELPGKIIKYRCAGLASKGGPRCPVFLGFRDADDM